MTRVDPPDQPPAPWGRPHLLVLGLSTALGAVLGWALRQRELLLLGDETVYLALSESLAEGHYRDTYLAGTPTHVQYPPGLPAWMLLVRTIAGPDHDILRAANLLLVLLSAGLVADLVRRLAGPWHGVAAGAAIALSPLLLERAGTLYSEPLYMALTVMALWAAQRAEEQPSPRWQVTSLVAALAGVITRIAGVAVLGGLAAGWLIRRQWRLLLAGGAASVAVIGGWLLHAVRGAGQTAVRSYGQDLAARESVAVGAELVRMADNARIYATQIVPTALHVPAIPGTPLDNLAALLLLGGLGMAGLWACARRAPALAASLAAYAVMLCFWVWPNERFLTPVVPLLVAVLVVGAHRVGGLLRRPARGLPLLLLLAVTVAPGLAWAANRARTAGACEAMREGSPLACFPERHRGFLAATEFIRRELPAEAVILGDNPSIIHHLTGRLTLPNRLLWDRDVAPTADALTRLGATHILLGPARSSDAPDRLAAAARDHCGFLATVASFRGAVLLAPRDPADESADACQDIAAFQRLTADLSRVAPAADPDVLR